MKINSGFYIVLSIFFLNPTVASSSNVSLSTHISSFITESLSHLEEKGYRFEHSIGSIDPRLSVGTCSENLNMSFSRNPTESQYNTIKVECQGNTPWKLFVSVQIDIYGAAVVAATPISRLSVIDHSVLEQKEVLVNRGNRSFFSSADEVAGMIAKRTISSGSTVTPSMLKAPNLVNRGDQVTIIAHNDTISIKMNGTALSNGALGQQISIRNNQSSRIVRATVAEQGKVTIAL